MTEPSPKSSKEPPVYALIRVSRAAAAVTLLELEDSQVRARKDEREVRCRSCAKLTELEFLKSGNAKVTQLAKKYSKRTVVVMQWSDENL